MSCLSALWLLSTVKLRVPSPGVSKGLVVKFRPENIFCVASFLNKAAEAHLTPLTITFPPLKPASPQTSPAFHLLPRPSRLSFASSMQISGCGQVSVSCVQAVSPIAKGVVQTVSTIANGFYYYCTNCTKRTNSFSYGTAGRANLLCYCNDCANCFFDCTSPTNCYYYCTNHVQTVSTIASSAQTMHFEKLTWAWPAKTGRVANWGLLLLWRHS